MSAYETRVRFPSEAVLENEPQTLKNLWADVKYARALNPSNGELAILNGMERLHVSYRNYVEANCAESGAEAAAYNNTIKLLEHRLGESRILFASSHSELHTGDDSFSVGDSESVGPVSADHSTSPPRTSNTTREEMHSAVRSPTSNPRLQPHAAENFGGARQKNRVPNRNQSSPVITDRSEQYTFRERSPSRQHSTVHSRMNMSSNQMCLPEVPSHGTHLPRDIPVLPPDLSPKSMRQLSYQRTKQWATTSQVHNMNYDETFSRSRFSEPGTFLTLDSTHSDVYRTPRHQPAYELPPQYGTYNQNYADPVRYPREVQRFEHYEDHNPNVNPKATPYEVHATYGYSRVDRNITDPYRDAYRDRGYGYYSRPRAIYSPGKRDNRESAYLHRSGDIHHTQRDDDPMNLMYDEYRARCPPAIDHYQPEYSHRNADDNSPYKQPPQSAHHPRQVQPSVYDVRRPTYPQRNDEAVQEGRGMDRCRPNDAEYPQLNLRSDFAQLAHAITDSIQLNRIPTAEPEVFKGNILQYRAWRTSFDQMVTSKSISHYEKMLFLKKYTSLAVQELFSVVTYRGSEQSFYAALDKLEERYGNPHHVIEEFRAKLAAQKPIGHHDHKLLRTYADLLRQINDAYQCLPGLAVLDDVHQLVLLAKKLPDSLRRRWATKVTRAEQIHHQPPTFADFAAFVHDEAQTYNNPVLQSLFEKQERTDPVRKKNFSTSATRTGENKSGEQSCLCCQRNHRLAECNKFKQLASKSQKELILQHRLCYGCLCAGHRSQRCQNRATCTNCKRRHPTNICGLYEAMMKAKSENPVATGRVAKEPVVTDTKKHSSTECGTPEKADVKGTKIDSKTRKWAQTYTMVVPVYVSTEEDPDNEQLIYALLDTQSDSSFILDSIAQDLLANDRNVDLELTTMNSTESQRCKQYYGLQVRGMKSNKVVSLPPTYGTSLIPADYSQVGTSETAKEYRHLKQIEQEVPPLQNIQFGLLIGCDCAIALAPVRQITTDMPFANKTVLGWSIIGSHSRTANSTMSRANVSRMSTRSEFDRIAKILESDFAGNKKENGTMSQEDIRFIKIIENSIHQNDEGFYEMNLPFKEKNTALPNNKTQALKRLEYLKRRLQKNKQYLVDYKTFMHDIITSGDAEEVPDAEQERPGNYIPHHGIYHKRRTNKIRVVFDCSSITDGTSLNQKLLQGPDMMNNLVGILCRFRLHTTAFIGDIEKMYHKFRVSPPDRDYLRFYWYRDGDLEKPPTMYRMKVFLFGAVCSPACANYALKKIASDFRNPKNQDAVDYITYDFYVDDGISGAETPEHATKIIQDAREICSKANMRLHKFISNSPRVLQALPESECATKKMQDLTFQTDDIDRVLGIQWCTTTDTLRFNLRLLDKPESRRGILSTVASIFDPLGLISPVTLRGKQILQKICQQNKSWDDPLDEHILDEWHKWITEITNLSEVQIPRCYRPETFGMAEIIELHIFCDASFAGYGACAYLRMVNKKGQIHCSLLMSKARVTPKKVMTIPRLELMAATVAVRLNILLQDELKMDHIKTVFWTDSQIVLSYLQNDAKRFHIFVSNRVQFILSETKREQWKYVPTADNPADSTSRGITVNQLGPSRWLAGPKFLWSPVLHITKLEERELSSDDPEVKHVVVHVGSTKEHFDLERRISKFSDWKRAVLAVNAVRRCIQQKLQRPCDSLVKELRSSELHIIKSCQAAAFPQAIEALKKHHHNPESPRMPLGSQILEELDPFLDDQMILRVGGRLKRSTAEYNTRHPIVLPNKSHTTLLIVKDIHERSEHQGRGMTIGAVRTSGFYVIGVSRLVSTLIFRCVTCRRLRSAPQSQKMADLPCDRIEESAPFTYTAIDCFGPYTITENRKQLKRYGLLFVCQASRSIHIEVLDDMSTDCFINGLRCFIAIRGAVAQIRCDQGSNFIGAAHELKESFKKINCERVKTALLHHQCEFKFNTPMSSHMGGTFERHIRTVRSILNNMLFNHGTRLNTSSLRTFMYEAMTLVNSRPLTVMSLTDAELTPLSPNNIIMMKSVTVMPPPGKFVPEDLYVRKRWRQVQQLANEFWNRWRAEYLLNLQRRQKWTKPRRSLKVDDVVVIKDETTYRGQWQLGRVVELLSENDLVRRVRVMTGEKKTLDRPIHKLVLLVENNSA